MTTIVNPLRKTNVDDAGDYSGPAAKPHIVSDELAELYAMATSLTVRVAILEHGQAHTDAVVHRYINHVVNSTRQAALLVNRFFSNTGIEP